jgi:nitroreductase
MIDNSVIKAMLNRKSVRKYKIDKPSDEVIETIVRAGQQAPFASQSYKHPAHTKEKSPFWCPTVVCHLRGPA